MFRKGIFFAVLMCLVMFLNGNSKHMRAIIERNKTHHNQERKLQETDADLYRKPKGTIEAKIAEASEAEDEFDGRKEAYMMFAPKLWDKAKNEPSASEEREQHRHHGHHRDHKEHHGHHRDHQRQEKEQNDHHDGKHKKHCCKVCPLKVILLITLAAHIYNLKNVRDALIQKEENKKALKAPAQKMKAQQAQVIYTQNIVPQMVFAPAPMPEKIEPREVNVNYALNESLVSVDISKISDEADKSEV